LLVLVGSKVAALHFWLVGKIEAFAGMLKKH